MTLSSTIRPSGPVYVRALLSVALGAWFHASACSSSVSSTEAVTDMNRGVGLLEQYQYLQAFQLFDSVSKKCPQWVAAHVNRGVAAFNLQDPQYLKEAEVSYGRALELDPKSPHALLSLAILYNYTQRLDPAIELARKVVAIDPMDPHAAYYLGIFLAEKGDYEEAKALLERVIALQPSFASAHYRLMLVHLKSGDMAKRTAAKDAFSRLDEAKVGVKVGNRYGENGRYNCAIRDTLPPGWKGPPPSWTPAAAPSFGKPVRIVAGPLAPRTRPDGKPLTPALAAADLTKDGVCEIVVPGAPGGSPGTTGIYGRGKDGAWSRVGEIPVDAILCALGDIDSDMDVDLVAVGDGWLRLFDNDGTGRLTEVPLTIEKGDHSGYPLRVYVADLDSDWDLDIACLRQETAEGGIVRSRLELLNNNRNGAFKDISSECGIEPFGFRAAEFAITDLDGDVDADFLVVDGDTGTPYFFFNDRLWRYRLGEDDAASPRAPGIVATTAGDFDGDGDPDILVSANSALALWRNEGGLRFREDTGFRDRFGGLGGTLAVAGDFLGAMKVGLLVVDGRNPSRSSGAAAAGVPAIPVTPSFVSGPGASGATAVSLEGVESLTGGASGFFTVLGMEGPPELIVASVAGGVVAYPLDRKGSDWIGIVLEGSRKWVEDEERANWSAIGAAVEIRAQASRVVLATDTQAGGTARSPSRLYFGLEGKSLADYARILWPDGVLQSELSLEGGKVHAIVEIERKPTSCPMLFAWSRGEFRFVADFLGVGGLGYLELPGLYSKPDPTEYVLLPSLEIRDGAYALEAIEPMEECTYLDELRLTVVDHPAGVTVIPEEMFAVLGPVPGFRLLGFDRRAFPARASGTEGMDATREILEVDRRYAYEVDRDPRFPGLSRRDEILDLDFEGGLGSLFESAGPEAPIHLVLHGYVEYGYSTSNFAAWQAAAEFRAPSVLVERGGTWVPLRERWGFPAGYPRYMTVDLTGLLRASDRRLRVSTNMDIHWDQAFLGRAGAADSLRTVDLAADEATLVFRGFPPEESPDGRKPKNYVWRDFRDFAPMKVFPGDYTRHGDVGPLLHSADDRFVVFGPGDGLSLRFRADRLPPIRSGERRTFLARSVGYCKDMDLYTALSERVEPLPFSGMSGYPFGVGESPRDPEGLEAERRTWNTRRVTGTFLDSVGDLPARMSTVNHPVH